MMTPWTISHRLFIFIRIGPGEPSPENDNDDDKENIAIEKEQILRQELKNEGLLLDYANDRAQRLADRLAELETKRVFQRARRVTDRVDNLVARLDLRQRKQFERRRMRMERKFQKTLAAVEHNQPTNPAA